MKKTNAVMWAVIFLVMATPMLAFAVVPSHYYYAAGITCINCHAENRTLGKTRGTLGASKDSPAAYNSLCQSCHRPGDGFGKFKPMVLVDASAIFGSHSTQNFGALRQTSHRWDGSDTNKAAGAQPPIQAAMTTRTNGVGNLRGRTGNQLACVRCHSPHFDNAPGAMLRMVNDQNEMCMDCHRSRNQTNHQSGTHPVNINYASKVAAAPAGAFYSAPQNANPVNNTSDLGNYLTTAGGPTGNIVCTTCHGVHYTDSRSSTFDGASTARGKGNYVNISSGDGYQLRTDRRGAKVFAGQTDKLNICSNCHANKKSHNAKDQDVQCNDCHGAHVEYDPNDPNGTIPTNAFLVRRNVKKGGMPSTIYFRYTGSRREYKNAAGTGVCQGCHNVPDAGGKYPAEHNSTNASVCNKCHSHNSLIGSFSGACGTCHGNPPIAIGIGGPDNLASPATGALSGAAGAHAKHVLSGLKMECNTCHDGYAGRVMPNKTIDIGFVLNGTNVPGFTNVLNTGTYNNSTVLQNGYGFVGSVNTSGTRPNQSCDNIYCHGATLTGGTKSNPSWVGTTTEVACGTCHGASTTNPPTAWPTAGSHARHSGSAPGQLGRQCSDCHGAHPDNTHVNGNVKWDFTAIGGQYKTPSGISYAVSGSTGRLAPSARYGTCDNIYCHSNSGPNNTTPTYGTPTWGASALNCGSCHADMSTITAITPNGGHFTHASNATGPKLDCSYCHTGYTVNSTNGATHANKLVELATGTGYLKGTSMPAGGAWGTCSNGNCHGQATSLAWGGSIGYKVGNDGCSTCHSSPTDAAGGAAFYSTKYPGKATLPSDAKVGYHTAHVTSAKSMAAKFDCSACHGAVSFATATHMNGSSTFVWSKIAMGNSSTLSKNLIPSYNPGTGQCTNVYCHGAAMPSGNPKDPGTTINPTWSSQLLPAAFSSAACGICHGFPPASHTTYNVTIPSGFPGSAAIGTACNCHDNINPLGNSYANIFKDKSLHINAKLEVNGNGGCNGCHGYPPVRPSFTGYSNAISGRVYQYSRYQNYTGAGGSHNVPAHVSPRVVPSEGWANCTNCHNQNDHQKYLPANVSMNSRLRFNSAVQPKYTSNKLPGAQHVAGTCSNVACHFQKTLRW